MGKIFKTNKSHYLLVGIVIFYTSISHIWIPLLGSSPDYFTFASWDLFIFRPKDTWYDITWDHGKTYLFRDHNEKALSLGINTHLLFYLTQKNYTRSIKSQFLKQLGWMGSCPDIEIVQLKGKLYDHIIKKSQLDILKMERLCDD